MYNAIVLEQKDIKKLIAEKYGVDEKDIVKTQDSYIIAKSDSEKKEDV